MQRRTAAAGEDVAVDKVRGIKIAVVVMIRHGDGLDQGSAIRFQPLGAGAEIGRQVTVADSFDHFYGDQPVETAGQVAVILLQQGDLIAKTFCCDSLR